MERSSEPGPESKAVRERVVEGAIFGTILGVLALALSQPTSAPLGLDVGAMLATIGLAGAVGGVATAVASRPRVWTTARRFVPGCLVGTVLGSLIVLPIAAALGAPNCGGEAVAVALLVGLVIGVVAGRWRIGRRVTLGEIMIWIALIGGMLGLILAGPSS